MDGGNDSGVMDEGGQKKRAISRHGRPGFLRCVEVGTLGLWATALQHWGLPDTRIRLVLSRPFRRETAKGCTARSTKGRFADPGPWLAAGCTYKPMTPWPPFPSPGSLVSKMCAAVSLCHVACESTMHNGQKSCRRLSAQAQAAGPRTILGLLTGTPLGGVIGERGSAQATTHAPSTL